MAGHLGPSGEIVWAPAVSRVSSGLSAAQIIQPSTEMVERAEGFTGKLVGKLSSADGTVNDLFSTTVLHTITLLLIDIDSPAELFLFIISSLTK